MAEIIWTEEAERWLKDIYDYIAQDNPDEAMKVVEGKYERAQNLATFPQIGHKYREGAEGEIRLLLYSHYRIAYLISGPDRIDVLGVFHGALKIDRYLE